MRVSSGGDHQKECHWNLEYPRRRSSVVLTPSRGSSSGGLQNRITAGGKGELWQRSSAPKSRSIEEGKDAEGWDLLIYLCLDHVFF
jgi:hypothetical protein